MNRSYATVLGLLFLLSSGIAVASPDIPPGGLVAVIKDVPGSPLDLSAVSNPYISGVALQIHWSEIEPSEGKPDWSKLDALFAAANSNKKWVQLFVFPGFFSPAWALDGVKTDQFALQYGPGHGSVESLPMPWNEVYLRRWFAFLQQLSDRYGASPAFRVIACAGPTSVSDELTLPNSVPDLKVWRADGYTPAKYQAAVRRTFDACASTFPNQYVSVSVGRGGDGLDINDGGKLSKGQSSETRQAIVDDASSIFENRFVLQLNDVHAGPDPSGATSQAEDEYVIGYAGRVVTGFQMGGSMEGAVGSKKEGAEGNPPLALRRSIDLAMEQNGAGRHVNFVEIYEADVVPADMQPVLKYGASLFSSRPPPKPHCVGTTCT